MEYRSYDSDLFHYYGLKLKGNFSFHSWQYHEFETVDLSLLVRSIQTISEYPQIILLVEYLTSKAIDRYFLLNYLLEQRFGLIGTTLFQNNRNDKGQWLCKGAVQTNNQQLKNLLPILYSMPFSSLALGCDRIDQDRVNYIKDTMNRVVSMEYSCPLLLTEGFDVLHCIRGYDGMTINLIQHSHPSVAPPAQNNGTGDGSLSQPPALP